MEELTRLMILSRFNNAYSSNFGALFPYLKNSQISSCSLSTHICYHFPKIVSSAKFNKENVTSFLKNEYDPYYKKFCQVSEKCWNDIIAEVQTNTIYVPAAKSMSADLYVFFKEEKKILAITVKSGNSLHSDSIVKEEMKKVFVENLEYSITLVFVSSFLPNCVTSGCKHNKLENFWGYHITSENDSFGCLKVPKNCEVIFLKPNAIDHLFCLENYSLWTEITDTSKYLQEKEVIIISDDDDLLEEDVISDDSMEVK
eukprot:TRINITY_DN13464_c0_g1_i1.p1 TRINITY_DN13464_c0_g1~~TRINITY_DN13464_c0_g1_i1.p1  ORF type:complete len:257 (-),score=52.26 TRINITY_DN13464_c0_g1_i1:208-978(-)